MLKAIHKLNGAAINGHRLKVSVAWVRRPIKDSSPNGRFDSIMEHSPLMKIISHHKDIPMEPGPRFDGFIKQSYNKIKTVQGEINNENLEWLHRSIVAEKATPINLAMVSERLLNTGRKVAEVRDWGSFLAFVTFESKEAMEEGISCGVEWLKSFFYEFRPWT